MFGFYFILSLLFVATSNGANILSVLPSSSKSHFIYPHSLLLELAASGHMVKSNQSQGTIAAYLIFHFR